MGGRGGNSGYKNSSNSGHGTAKQSHGQNTSGLPEISGNHPLGTLTERQYLNSVGWADGLSSPDGSLKHITLYHGSFQEFDKFDYEKGKAAKGGGMDQYGQGFYFTSDRKKAEVFGDNIYTVDVAYSTSMRVGKRTGREIDFQYNPETGYWVIPKKFSHHLQIKNVRRVRK